MFQTAKRTKKKRLLRFSFGVPCWIFPKRLTQDFQSKLEFFFLLIFLSKQNKKRCLTMFQTANKPKRAFIKTFIFGVPYWIFSKGLTHDFESKLESFFLIFCLSTQNKERCMTIFQTAKSTQKSVDKTFYFGGAILDFSKGVNP